MIPALFLFFYVSFLEVLVLNEEISAIIIRVEIKGTLWHRPRTVPIKSYVSARVAHVCMGGTVLIT